MTGNVLTSGKFTKLAQKLSPNALKIGAGGAVLCTVALLFPQSKLGLLILAVGAVLLWSALIVRFVSWRHTNARNRIHASISAFVEHDAAPSFTTDSDGVIDYENIAAIQRFGKRGGQTQFGALEAMFAAPNATFSRLQACALAKGAAREDVVMGQGHMRLSVHSIGDGGFLWRLEDMADRSIKSTIDSIALPMLTLSKNGSVLFSNDALRRLIGHRDSQLDRIITDLPLRAGDIHMLAGAEGRIYARVAVFDTPPQGQEVYFLPEKTPNVNDWDAFDALPVALLRVGLDGSITQSNRPAREILSVIGTEGLSLGDVVEGLGRSVVDWVSEVAMGRARKPEFVRASRSNNDTFLQVSLNRIESKDTVELIAVLSDATELKSLEAQFVQSQKMQAIGQLAGGVAHDFNNLLTAISGHCDLLLLRHDRADPDYGDLVQIHQNANRAASLVGQLLAFSRKQTLKPEVIDLRDTLADLTHLLNRLVGEKVSLTLSHDAGLLPIRVDKRQLEQVVMNLVVNARDAMVAGGEIKVETRNEILTADLVRDRASVPEGEYVLVKVTDQGVGIPPERLQKIFEPFFTTKRTGEGTGLGLSTAYGIIKQTGGFIFVDSVVGSGTSFSIYLPAHTALAEAIVEVTPPVATVSTNYAERGTGVILLVEDEAPVRAFASRALRMRGYTVIEADCAEEALETLADPELTVDIFVTDVIMPGMDGPTWVSEALKARPNVKVVFVSGYAEDHFSEQQARIPNSVFLPKPFSLSELTSTVQEQLL
ncbi:ATP-binding protein [Pacificibacter marinus]|uniref:histidine kinase n=1 Tax=Pacificibacter marinus TaxID=658057 RepID=A0A1Y5SZS0_9RHOB|nr:ATP-binding protein [Pacificibacter marinus]SEK83832.1 two-component system, cell cycle sensor histidine kinase and response regulator CckA [Pacificibacter marinus]SLN48792.1 Blue-light-activated protein [Pacificibacter marinus]